MALTRTGRNTEPPGSLRAIRRTARLGATAMLCALGAASVSRAQLADTPWPTFHHDSQRTGRSPYLGPETPALKWRFRLANFSQSSIAIGEDGTIYCGDDGGIVYAINPDGTEKWRFQTLGDRIHSSGPSINVDGTIYIGTTLPAGFLYALNPDGSERWRFETGQTGHVYGAPAIGDDGTIYFGCRDLNLYALTPSGQVQWRFPAVYIAAAVALGHDGRIYASTYAGYPNLLYCVDRQGLEVWRDGTESDTWGGSSIGDDGVIYTQTYRYLYAHNADGTVRWELRNGVAQLGAPCIGEDGTIFTISEDGFTAVSPEGEILWTASHGANAGASPIVDADGTLYLGTLAFNPDGSLKWVFREGQYYNSRPAMGSDGTYYLIGYDWLYAIGPGRGKPGPLLSLTGDCPGRIEAAVSRATPGGRIALILSARDGCAGQTTIQSGSCAGTVLPIDGARLVRVLIADGGGSARLAGTVPGGACGHRCLIALDAATCRPSNAVGF